MSMQKAAEELNKVADMIEKEAAEVTQFVCDKCSHTATLSTINGRRQEAAKTAGENVVVSAVSVNDKVACPACEGVMAYKETEASAPFFYNPEKTAEAAKKCEKCDKEECDCASKTASAPIDYDSLERYTK